MPKILIVDDQRNMRTTLAMMLRGVGYEVDEAADGEQGAANGATGAFDLVLTDLRMGQKDGIDVLRAIKERQPLTEVIVMTAYGTIESAVEAMRLGAFDYIQKPFTEQELLVKVQKALDNRRLAGEVAFLATEFKDRYKFENIVGRSTPIREVLGRIIRIAPTDATVLITGESGTGKELVAKAIHANSRRADRAFVSINCAALTETLLESELFGHAKGSFTGAVTARKGLFEEADGGTFFFDEIAETPGTVQAKLLRAIQEHEIRRVGENKPIHVDVRIVAATNQDLLKAVAEKRFRQDLYYRLNVARFVLPPLRERREDVPELLSHFLDKYNQKMQVRARLSDNVLDALARYDFPGNVRELEHMLEQAVALVQDGVITADDLLSAYPSTPPRSGSDGRRTLADVVDSAEKVAIESALQDCG
ncbi:MAG TPA: sigma-54 dependent transcriptional regulator, partial [Polyangiaceae bacterium]|nr:sigma-54 dependent transcriptional regulator [Polyangiaceae bacterium]